jgi:hypothetical protein
MYTILKKHIISLIFFALLVPTYSFALVPTQNTTILNTIKGLVHGGAGVQSISGTLLIGSNFLIVPYSISQGVVTSSTKLQVLSRRNEQGQLIDPLRPAVFSKTLGPVNSFFTVLQTSLFAQKVFVGFTPNLFLQRGIGVQPVPAEWVGLPVTVIPERLNIRGNILATNLNGLSGNVTGQNNVCVNAAGTLILCEPKNPAVDIRFDECTYNGTSGEVQDIAGALTNAKGNGGIDSTNQSKIGRSLELDGVNGEFVDGQNSAISVNLNEQITIATWVRTSSDPSAGINWIADARNNCLGWNLNINTVGGIAARLQYGTGCGSFLQSNISTPAGVVNDGLWHHIAVSIDRVNHEIKMYVDGNLSSFAQLPATGLSSPSTHSLVFGNSPDGTQAFRNGSIDEFKIYRDILTGVEVRELYITENSLVRGVTCS